MHLRYQYPQEIYKLICRWSQKVKLIEKLLEDQNQRRVMGYIGLEEGSTL